MALARKYIVLRTASGVEPRGYVKISADGRALHLQARVTGFGGELWLILAGNGWKRSAALKLSVGGAEYSGKMDITASGRILAAVHNTDGKLLAVGESDPPAASWSEFSRLVDKPKPEPRLSRPEFTDFGKKLVSAKSAETDITNAEAEKTESKESIFDIKQAAEISSGPAAEIYKPATEEVSQTIPMDTVQPVNEDTAVSEYQQPLQIQPEPASETDQRLAGAADINISAEARAFEPETLEDSSKTVITVVADEQSIDETQKPAYAAEKANSGKRLSATENDEQPRGPLIRETLGKWKWKKVVYRAGQGFYYLTGSVEKNGELLAVAVAVPGEYSKTPPPNLRGFCGYADGYWVLAQNAKTGAKLEI